MVRTVGLFLIDLRQRIAAPRRGRLAPLCPARLDPSRPLVASRRSLEPEARAPMYMVSGALAYLGSEALFDSEITSLGRHFSLCFTPPDRCAKVIFDLLLSSFLLRVLFLLWSLFLPLFLRLSVSLFLCLLHCSFLCLLLCFLLGLLLCVFLFCFSGAWFANLFVSLFPCFFFVWFFVRLFVRSFVCLFVRFLFVCFFVCFFVCLFACFFLSFFVSLSVCLFVCSFVCLVFCCLFVRRFLRLLVCQVNPPKPGSKARVQVTCRLPRQTGGMALISIRTQPKHSSSSSISSCWCISLSSPIFPNVALCYFGWYTPFSDTPICPLDPMKLQFLLPSLPSKDSFRHTHIVTLLVVHIPKLWKNCLFH